MYIMTQDAVLFFFHREQRRVFHFNAVELGSFVQWFDMHYHSRLQCSQGAQDDFFCFDHH